MRRRHRVWPLLLVLGGLVSLPASGWADTKVTTLYNPTTKTSTASSAQTDTALWTPASGARAIVQGCIFSADAAQTVLLEVSNVAVLGTISLDADATSTVSWGFGAVPVYVGAADGVLTYTTTTTAATTVSCSGWEDVN